MMNELAKVNENKEMAALFGSDFGTGNIMETVDYVKLPKIEILKEVAMYKFNEDDNDVNKEFVGYIIGKTTGRAHWPKPINEQVTDEDKAPDCVSADGKSGSKFSTNCDKCPLNYLNIKDPNARVTACKASLNLFIYIDGRGDVPFHLKAGATSIKYWTPFALKLAQKYGKIPLSGVKIKFKLKSEVKNNMKYATVQYEEAGLVESREVYERNKKLSETFVSAMYRNTEAAATAAEPTNNHIGEEENPF